MPRTNHPSKPKILTEVELEMMQVLWDHGSGTVSEVRNALGKDRPLAYTSVATMLRILESKGFVRSEKQGRGHRYHPMLSRATYERTSVSHFVEKMFAGTPSALAKLLIQDGRFSRDELAELHTLLENKFQ